MIADWVSTDGGPLLLNSGGYRVQKGPVRDAVVQSRRTATSPWTHGAALLTTTKALTGFTVTILVEGSTYSELWSRVDTLTEAFEQTTYTYRRVRNGRNVQWDCFAADYTIGDSYIREQRRLVPVALVVPRQPWETVT